MRVVITGAAGTLGQALARALLQAGAISRDGEACPVTELILIDSKPPPGGAEPEGATWLQADLTSPGALATIGSGVDAVFHLAAIAPEEAEASYDTGLKGNLTVLQGLLSRCRRSESKPRIVFPSSHLVYGAAASGPVGDYTAPLPCTSYGALKLVGEVLVGDFSRRGWVDGRCIRLPTVLPRGGSGGAAFPVHSGTPLLVATVAEAVAHLLRAFDIPEETWTGSTQRGALLIGGSLLKPLDVAGAGWIEDLREEPGVGARGLPIEVAAAKAAALEFAGGASAEDIAAEYE